MKYKLTEQAKQLRSNNYPPLVFAPRQGTSGSSGYDLSACMPESITLLANEECKIGTGIHIWIDSDSTMDECILDNTVKLAGLLMPRSSIKGCMLTNTIGLIDSDYQGEIICSLWNRTDNPITITPGQKIAQLVYILTYLPNMELVEEFIEITDRGVNGFGSTGN